MYSHEEQVESKTPVIVNDGQNEIRVIHEHIHRHEHIVRLDLGNIDALLDGLTGFFQENQGEPDFVSRNRQERNVITNT